MFYSSDEEYLNNPDYSMALEKYFDNQYYRDDWNNQTIMKAYAFSNEDMKEMFRHLRVKDKKVLTVGSSGDQAINALYYGAKDVTIIDANLFTKYYTEYKIAAIKNLNYKEFIDYFITFEAPFAKQVYQKIFHDLDKDTQTFWGIIFLHDGDDEFNKGIYSKISERVDCNMEEISSSFYKNPILYNRLQKKFKLEAPSVKYINAEFGDFPVSTEEKYDLILLSNIYTYTHDYFKSVVDDLYKNNLTANGKIQLHYNFHNGDRWLGFYHMFPKNKINKYDLGENNFTYFLSKSKYDNACSDASSQM